MVEKWEFDPHKYRFTKWATRHLPTRVTGKMPVRRAESHAEWFLHYISKDEKAKSIIKESNKPKDNGDIKESSE
jgi:hypothetical protein